MARGLLFWFLFLGAGCTRPQLSWSTLLDAEARGNLDPTHTAVVLLSTGCSGTLITPRRVLTAAHCVTQDVKLAVWVGLEGPAPEQQFSVARCFVHPLAYGAPTPCGLVTDRPLAREHDLAILYLDNEVPAQMTRPYPALVESPIPIGHWPATSVQLVGWHRWPQRDGPLRRYAGVQEITYADAVFITRPSELTAFYTRRGNSGGPAILNANGRDIVVGVLSGGSSLGTVGPRFSVYAPTFGASNAVWVRAHLEWSAEQSANQPDTVARR